MGSGAQRAFRNTPQLNARDEFVPFYRRRPHVMPNAVFNDWKLIASASEITFTLRISA